MRVFLVIDETPFFHPSFVEQIVTKGSDDFVGAFLVTKILPKNNISYWLKKNWHFLRLSELFKLGIQTTIYTLLDRLGFSGPGKFFSVRSVLKHHGIKYREIHHNINQPEYLEFVKALKPDVIVSSCSLIFKTELLKIPTLCCLNRHSGLLPAFGGLWPVFQAFRLGERFAGASVHTMELKIDRGIVLAQSQVPITSDKTLYDLYKSCFQLSVNAVLEALNKVRANDYTPIDNGKAPSYFSFPTAEHWRDFRARGGIFI